MAKNSLKKEYFSKVAEVVPSMDALLNTGPYLAKNPNTANGCVVAEVVGLGKRSRLYV